MSNSSNFPWRYHSLYFHQWLIQYLCKTLKKYFYSSKNTLTTLQLKEEQSTKYCFPFWQNLELSAIVLLFVKSIEPGTFNIVTTTLGYKTWHILLSYFLMELYTHFLFVYRIPVPVTSASFYFCCMLKNNEV